MHWVVQSNMYAVAELQWIIHALEDCNVRFSLHKVVPFSHELIPHYEPTGPTIVLGTFSLCKIARDHGWTPGSYVNWKFNHSEVAKHWPTLNRDGVVHRLAEVPEQPEPFFLRPLDDGKVFPGHITDWTTFFEWRDRVIALGYEGTVTPDTLVLVAVPKRINVESRVWVVDRRPVAASVYKRGTLVRYEPDCDSVTWDFATKMAQLWDPARAYCIDVALTSHGPMVVELTTFNSAGFYAADIKAIVKAIER